MTKTIRRNGQGTLEYSTVIICIVAALLSMQFYIKRAIQGRMRESADSIGEQYSPGNMDSEITVTQRGNTTIKAEVVPDNSGKFGMKTTSTTDESITRAGYENVGKFEEKLFD